MLREVLDLVHQGGMQSMIRVILRAFSDLVFTGIMTKSGALEVIIEYLLKFVKSTGDLILTTVLSCLTMILVTDKFFYCLHQIKLVQDSTLLFYHTYNCYNFKKCT